MKYFWLIANKTEWVDLLCCIIASESEESAGKEFLRNSPYDSCILVSREINREYLTEAQKETADCGTALLALF